VHVQVSPLGHCLKEGMERQWSGFSRSIERGSGALFVAVSSHSGGRRRSRLRAQRERYSQNQQGNRTTEHEPS
jgi:hypothetical protein